MIRIFFTSIFCIFMAIGVYGQIIREELDYNQYPANNQADSRIEAAFAAYFEEENVSNTHVYLPPAEVSYDYYLKGTKLPRGLFGLFDEAWRNDMPEDFKAFAVFAMRGEGKPYYLLRFSGEEIDPSIELFEMVDQRLHHLATLATYWCDDDYCLQKDSWLQDFDGNVRIDILSKVKMTDERRKRKVVDEYYLIHRQLKDGRFVTDSQMEVDVNDYFMYDPEAEEE